MQSNVQAGKPLFCLSWTQRVDSILLSQVLLEITKICHTEAAALLVATQHITQQITDAIQASRAQKGRQHVDTDQDGDLDASNIDDVKAYFAEHHRQQAQATAANDTVDPGILLMVTYWHS